MNTRTPSPRVFYSRAADQKEIQSFSSKPSAPPRPCLIAPVPTPPPITPFKAHDRPVDGKWRSDIFCVMPTRT